MKEDEEAAIPSLPPGLRNPNKMQNLRPGQGAEGRKKHVRSIANRLRRYLESPKKQALDSQGRNRLQRVFDTLFTIATDDKHPHAVAAAQVLLDRAYGKPKPSEEEMNAVRTGGIQVVIVNRPEVPLRVEPKELIVPDFLEAEIVPTS